MKTNKPIFFLVWMIIIFNNYSNAKNRFSCAPIITISSVVPTALPNYTTANNSGFTGQTLTINGTSFDQSDLEVSIAGVNVSFNYVNASSLTVIVPASIGSGNIKVSSNNLGQAAFASFTYNGYITTTSGNWNTGSTWLGNNVPPNFSDVTINNPVVLSSDANTILNLTVTPNGNLTMDANNNVAGAGIVCFSGLRNSGTISMVNYTTITLKPSTNFDNTGGTLTASGNSLIKFQGAGQIIGTTIFNQLIVEGQVTLSNNVTINKSLSLNPGGSIIGYAPFYNANSCLVYNTGATHFPGLEWSSTAAQPGFPYNIQIGQNLNDIVDISGGSTPTIANKISIGYQSILSFGNSANTLTILQNLDMDDLAELHLSTNTNGKLILKSDWTTKGTVVPNAGTVQFDDKTKDQSLYCLHQTDLNNLTIDKGNYNFILGTTSPISKTTIAGTINIISGNFDMNNRPLSLLSTAANTASIGAVDISKTTISNTSNLEVQRYVPARRAWVMLSVPVNGTQTVHDSWQESQTNTAANTYNNLPGYGVQITGPQTGVGFDISQQNNTSMLFYNSAINKWTPIPGTTNANLNDHEAYMLFVRGSRAVNIADGVNAASSPTTLRSRGSLIYGQVVKNITPQANFTLLRNPYPSTIDFHQLTRSAGLGDTFIAWDPYLTGTFGVGAFVTFTWNGSSYSATPAPASPLDQFIQSGQAFIVPGSGTSETITFNESNKILANKASIFGTMGDAPAEARIDLFAKSNDNNYNRVDGTLAIYNDAYSNKVNKMDAPKISNFNENIALQRGSHILAIEARSTIMNADTLYLHLKAPANNYKLRIIGNNLLRPGLTGLLIDNFAKTSIALNLNDTIFYPFNIGADTASANPSRFSIIFQDTNANQSNITLTGEKQGDAVSLNWMVTNENNVKNYEVMRSENGLDFRAVATIDPKSNASQSMQYTFTDKPKSLISLSYRIKINTVDGGSKFSNRIDLFGSPNDAIKIFPNPVTNGNINIHFAILQKGNYKIKLFDTSGKMLFSQDAQKDPVDDGSMAVHADLPHGIYFISITCPDKTVITKTISYQ